MNPEDPRAFPPNAVHLMRTAQLAQIQLSAMADTKASILMGATFVVFTITLGRAAEGDAPAALLVLGGFAFLAAIFAVLAVLPALHSKARGQQERNLLFFGEFSAMDEEAFVEALLARLGSEEAIYRTMARDIHQAGSVLARKKYRMLAIAYRLLLAGLVGSGGAFLAGL